ncbi:hypothetical protein ACGYLO_10760 [Sulfitobacter sp. 1A13353]|uniref:ATP-dependent DNA ligase n=1 Tax=Sulfitobacter sp. 1A13353 TaxID=3368568 RepID=UPI0037467F2A
MEAKSVALRLKAGSSDKAYTAELKQEGTGWVVHCANGRYGGTLKPQIKTPDPVDYETADKIYTKIVNEKTRKGYTAGGDGVAFAGTENAGRVTGFQPQLLNPTTEEELLEVIAREPGQWVAQVKFDGERRGLNVVDGKITTANKLGLEVPVRGEFAQAVEALVAAGLKDFAIDCEDMGKYLVPFDVLSIDGTDLANQPLKARLHQLNVFSNLCAKADVDDTLRCADTWVIDNVALAKELIARHREKKAEGLVFKRLDAPYVAGKPNSGGDQVKLKFYNDITARVSGHTTGKRSVSMELLQDGDWTEVGKVTVPANKKIPEIGALIDVQYLYAYEGGSLFQPTFRGVRTDYLEEDCTTDKLCYKPDDEYMPSMEAVEDDQPSL